MGPVLHFGQKCRAAHPVFRGIRILLLQASSVSNAHRFAA
jgi:hypothetical protein